MYTSLGTMYIKDSLILLEIMRSKVHTFTDMQCFQRTQTTLVHDHNNKSIICILLLLLQSWFKAQGQYMILKLRKNVLAISTL